MTEPTGVEEKRDMELILEVLPHLILGNAEALYKYPQGQLAQDTISEMQRVIRETHHQELQKARQTWLRDLEEVMRVDIGDDSPTRLAVQALIDRYQGELDQDKEGMKGIELLANMVRGEISGWYAKPEHCAHMFNYGGYMGDSEMSRCLICNKTKADLNMDTQLLAVIKKEWDAQAENLMNGIDQPTEDGMPHPFANPEGVYPTNK